MRDTADNPRPGGEKAVILQPEVARSGCASAIESQLIALMDIDFGRDSAMLKHAWIALAAPSVRLALTLHCVKNLILLWQSK